MESLLKDPSSSGIFWTFVGYMIVSNIGLLAGALISHFKKIQKMSLDINIAHQKIRIINKHLKLDSIEIENENTQGE